MKAKTRTAPGKRVNVTMLMPNRYRNSITLLGRESKKTDVEADRSNGGQREAAIQYQCGPGTKVMIEKGKLMCFDSAATSLRNL